MFLKIIWFFIILLVIVCGTVQGQGCTLDIKNSVTDRSPVFIKNGDLHIPSGQYLTWNKNEVSNIICTGPKNNFINSNFDTLAIQCISNDGFLVNGKQIKITQLECVSQCKADVIPTNRPCLDGGKIYDIGFSTQTIGFIQYLEVCYNLTKISALYTTHRIFGQAIDYAMTGGKRPTFSVKELPKNSKADFYYSQNNQLDRFTNLFGPTLSPKYINQRSFLARGHLTPDKDGIFRTWQNATYFYLNVAPQWQSINAGNWFSVEKLARAKAGLLKDELQITTGTIGILSLKNSNDIDTQITLVDNGNIIVPKYSWKILRYRDETIAFITSNNPFDPVVPFCNDICVKYRWPTTDFNEITKGQTFCCKTTELLNAYSSDIPREAVTTKVLRY